MDSIYAALIGVVGTALVGFIAWALMRIVVRPVETLIQEVSKLHIEQSKMKERQAVLHHLCTQMVLRIEWLEDQHSRTHKHPHRNGKPSEEEP